VRADQRNAQRPPHQRQIAAGPPAALLETEETHCRHRELNPPRRDPRRANTPAKRQPGPHRGHRQSPPLAGPTRVRRTSQHRRPRPGCGRRPHLRRPDATPGPASRRTSSRPSCAARSRGGEPAKTAERPTSGLAAAEEEVVAKRLTSRVRRAVLRVASTRLSALISGSRLLRHPRQGFHHNVPQFLDEW